MRVGDWLLALFLVTGVALPVAAVLWFMNAAAASEAAAARQSVVEAYRGQLRLIRDRIDGEWEVRASGLARQSGRGAAEDFARVMAAQSADSVIFLGAEGTPTYPAQAKTPSADPAADLANWREAQNAERLRNWQNAVTRYVSLAKSEGNPSLAARAAQGEIRSRLQIDRVAALSAIFEYFSAGRLVNATDLQGRIIAADEHLLALRLMASNDRRRAGVLLRLTGWLNDYKSSLPSAQRLFLMTELIGMGVSEKSFPTYQAETLAARVLETDIRAGMGLEATRVPDIWKLTTKGGRAMALFRTSTVMGLLSVPSSVFKLVPPGTRTEDEAIAAGPMLTGWQIAFSLQDSQRAADDARRRTTSKFIAGYVVIAVLCATGLLLSQMLRRQMQLTRLKTDLVATVSHELKTPLASMRLLVDALLEEHSPDPVKTREYLRLISGENLRLTRLIENFLTFSRIERRRQTFEFGEVETARVAEAAAQSMRERFPLTLEVEPNLPPLYADEDAVVTAVLNLLDNAYKYTPPDKQIALRVFRKGTDVVFAVEDNGIGISPREQKRIFRKFYQVDRRLARETGGCGLGLSIVEYIVRAHQGSVRVQSRPGAGSTFFLSLPFRKHVQGAAA
jgi:signal transduction histidine kinase